MLVFVEQIIEVEFIELNAELILFIEIFQTLQDFLLQCILNRSS